MVVMIMMKNNDNNVFLKNLKFIVTIWFRVNFPYYSYEGNYMYFTITKTT